MKKYLSYLLVITISIIFSIGKVNASQNGIVNGTGVRLRKGPATSYYIEETLTIGASLVINETVKGEDNNCSTDWYKVTYNTKEGYVCGEYVTIIYDTEDGQAATTDYEKVLSESGFPSSYWPYLKALHEKHPNWFFKKLDTGISFETAATKESKIGISLLQGNEGYRSTDSSVYNYYTNKWVALDGSNWYAANRQTVEYYLDPRNWLNESTIFMFEDLSYNSTFHTSSMVSSILSITKLKNYDSNYVNHFMSAASSYNVSPVYLASRVRQEVGTSTTVVSGVSFTYNSKNYSNLYNPYNIGATSGSDNWKKGLVWANGGQKGTELSTSYLRPWNTLEKGVKGGANYIASGYINKKQNTNYLQKFNVANGESKVGTHQYMTNIKAPSSEATTTYSSYKEYNIVDEALVFAIPVYSNMPIKTSLPSSGNPNNYLKTLKINNDDVVGFDGAKTSYTIYVPTTTTSVNITATKVVNSGNISGTGTLTLTGDTTTKNIVVTAQNGSQKTYTVNIVRSQNVQNSVSTIVSNSGYKIESDYISNISIGTLNSTITSKLNNNGGNVAIANSDKKVNKDALATGDKITISNGSETKTYTILVKGDSNGDGKVNAQDYTNIKREKVNNVKITGYYRLAADVNNDGQITSVDYVNIKNYILGKKSVLK